MSTFLQLFLVNFKIFIRNRNAFFWTIAMPSILYSVLSVLPIGKVFSSLPVKYSTFLLPGLLASTIMQNGIYSLAYWLVDLKARGALKRFLVTPITQNQLFAGVLASRLAFMIIQSFILVVLALIFFQAVLTVSWLNLGFIIFFILLGGSIFLLLGLVIASFADTYEAAAPITAAIGLPLNFLSSIFYPLEVLPQSLQVVARLLPMTYFADSLRMLFLEPFMWNRISLDLFVLIIWCLIALCLVAWRFRFSE